jgi:hypothetical protein
MLHFVPVKKLSRQMPSWPASISRSQKCEPIKLAPPATKADLRSIRSCREFCRCTVPLRALASPAPAR